MIQLDFQHVRDTGYLIRRHVATPIPRATMIVPCMVHNGVIKVPYEFDECPATYEQFAKFPEDWHPVYDPDNRIIYLPVQTQTDWGVWCQLSDNMVTDLIEIATDNQRFTFTFLIPEDWTKDCAVGLLTWIWESQAWRTVDASMSVYGPVNLINAIYEDYEHYRDFNAMDEPPEPPHNNDYREALDNFVHAVAADINGPNTNWFTVNYGTPVDGG